MNLLSYLPAWKGKPRTLYILVAFLIASGFFLLAPILFGSGSLTNPGYPIAKTDHISSWSWDGPYADGANKQASAEAEIARMKGLLGKGNPSDYDLFVGIASQYDLLGDGQSAYLYLSRAIKEDPKRGIAYMNLGHLMEELGAITTAHQAYDAAVAAEPANPLYQAARQNFLVHHTSK